jgi:hypothetical protein
VSDPRIDRLRHLGGALETGDRDEFRVRVARVMHADCEWVPLIGAVEGRRYVGQEGMAEFFDDFLGTFEAHYVDTYYEAVGEDAVLFLSTMELSGRESGVSVTRELGVVFEFDGDRVRRARAHDSHAAARGDAEALHA